MARNVAAQFPPDLEPQFIHFASSFKFETSSEKILDNVSQVMECEIESFHKAILCQTMFNLNILKTSLD